MEPATSNGKNVRCKAVRHAWLDLDLLAVLVQRWSDIKDVQRGRDVDEERRVCEVPPGADPVCNMNVYQSPLHTRKRAHLLPKPNANSYGSRTFGSNFPLRMKRSGRNSSGSSYTFGSCKQALRTTEDQCKYTHSRLCAHQTFARRVVPAGMK